MLQIYYKKIIEKLYIQIESDFSHRYISQELSHVKFFNRVCLHVIYVSLPNLN